MYFTKNIKETKQYNYGFIINKIRHLSVRNLSRILCLYSRTRYLNIFILSKLWCIASVLELSKIDGKKIQSICAWFLWRNYIFRVRYTDLCQSYERGGLNLTNVYYKIQSLYIRRLIVLFTEEKDSVTKRLFSYFVNNRDVTFPLAIHDLLQSCVYLRSILTAYLYIRTNREVINMTCKQWYEFFQSTLPPPTKLEKQEPHYNWTQIW